MRSCRPRSRIGCVKPVYDAQAVREVGLREAEDRAIWRHAQTQGRVIITKDEDFALRAQIGVGQ